MMPRWISKIFRPKALYEAADPRKPHPSWRDGRDGDATVAMAGERLRRFARHLDQNHDISHGALDRLVQFTVGSTGIAIEPVPKNRKGDIHRDFADRLLELWNDWTEWPEVTFEHDWAGVQRLLARSLFRDGEVFVQVIAGDRKFLDHGTRIPLSLELIEADQVPLDFNDPARGITQGIERDAWGRPRAYYVYKTHPGALYGASAASSFVGDMKRIPTENILHLKLTDRIKQARGVTRFASVIRRLNDVKQYEDDERIAANIAARMTAFIKKTLPDLAPPDTIDAPRQFELSPGMIFDDLRPGEDVGLIDTKRPNPQVEDFRKGQLRAAAAGFGVSYSSLARDYNGTYSSQRQELVEQQGDYDGNSALFIGQLVRPVWQRAVEVAIISGVIAIPKDLQELTASRAEYQAQAMPWIDPLREYQSLGEAINARLLSPQQAIRERGGNPAEVIRQFGDWYRQLAAAGVPVAGPSSSTGNQNDPMVSNPSRRPAKNG